MNNEQSDIVFAGSIPDVYDAHLVPLIFEPYAVDIAARLATRPLSRVLEIAAGTGVVTRAMASAFPWSVSIMATDLNQPMLDRAARAEISRPVEWRQADAMNLPFADASFDTVVCQFGVMFFPDKAKAFAEARRVLSAGGVFAFNVWDRISENEFADTITNALRAVFPDDPPTFLARTPHGYFDPETIRQDLARGGFAAPPLIAVLPARSRARSARIPAIAYCQGTPLRNEIEARNPTGLADATEVAAEAIARQFGHAEVDGKIQALVVLVEN